MANLRVDKITSTETFEKTGSVQFDGSVGQLTVSGSNSATTYDFGTDDFTIEFWRYKSSSAVESYVSRLDAAGGSATSDFWFGNVNGVDGFYYYEGSTGRNISTESQPLNTWAHLAVVRNNDYLRLYLNGKEVVSKPHSAAFNNGSANLRIGGDDASSGNTRYPLEGFLSNVRITKKALYTSNFKPPMRELEVTAETVLLACQSKTDASLEKTGKTLVVGGTPVANELTPGILTPIVKSGGGSAITGSVEFTGAPAATVGTDYLNVSSTDFAFGTSDFSVEMWFNSGDVSSAGQRGLIQLSDTVGGLKTNYTSGFVISTGVNNAGSGSDNNLNCQILGDNLGSNDDPLRNDTWHHVALTRQSGTARLFLNGILLGSSSAAESISAEHLVIGGWYSTSYLHKGFISNLRIVRGTALYTDSFIPPTRELKRVPGTVLLCCQDSNDPTQEATGKTISLNGIYTYDTVVTSGITTAPGPSNFTPQVGDDRQITFEGVTKINSDAYFYLPTGDTASRETTGTYNAGTRGIFGGGFSSPSTHHDTIQYINIASLGNAVDAGNLTQSRYGNAALASDTRAVWAGGVIPSPAIYNIIDAVEIMSTGNAYDFGDLYNSVYYPAGFSNRTRGIYSGGAAAPLQNDIGYITISSKGNSVDFGNLITARNSHATFSSPTRGVMAGGFINPTRTTAMEYVTIATTGNGQDFGDLTQAQNYAGGCGSAIRGLVGGGNRGNPSTVSNLIEYVTISAMGNAQDFGDLTSARAEIGSCSSATRGIFAGAWSPSKVNTIDYVTIQTTANAQDFGDLVNIGVMQECGTSNGHGGLG